MLSRFGDALQLCILHYEPPDDFTEEIYSHDKQQEGWRFSFSKMRRYA